MKNKTYFYAGKTAAKNAVAALLFGGVFAVTPCKAETDPVVAKVGEMEIKASQIRPSLSGMTRADKENFRVNPGALNQLARSLILQQVLFREAVAAGWDKESEVAAKVERAKQAVVAEAYLDSVTKVPDGFPSAQEVQSFYEAKKEAFRIPKQYELAQIYISFSKEAGKAGEEKAKGKIEAVAKAIKGGADFSAQAVEASEERESAVRGGVVGWLAETAIRPEIRAKVVGLGKGATSEPIRLDDGFYLVKVKGIKEERVAGLEEVKGRVADFLREERAKKNREIYLSKLQQMQPVSVNEVALGTLVAD